MNPILQALQSGYSEEEILRFITKAFPKAIDPIKKSLKAGYGINEILGYLSKSTQKQDLTGLSQSQIHKKNRESDEKLVKTGLGIATAGALSSGVAQNALSRALPSSLQSIIPETASNMINDTNSLSSKQPISQPENALSQTTTLNQPSSETSLLEDNITKPQVNLQDILTKTNSKERIDALLKSGNGPQEISGFFEKFASPIKKMIEKETGMPFEKVIEDYASKMPQENIVEEQETPESIQVNETVGTPHGIGEVKAIRNGKAIIDVDGKRRQVNEEELIQSPIPEKDLAELYDDLLSGIESETGEEVSRNVNWAGYDPTTNELAYRPHNGRLYVYNDISPEDVQELTSILSKRKTTGENFIGAWKQGSKSPIGAAMFKLIRRLQEQRGGKGNEYKNRFETVYDALEPAVLALKKKKKKR